MLNSESSKTAALSLKRVHTQGGGVEIDAEGNETQLIYEGCRKGSLPESGG